MWFKNIKTGVTWQIDDESHQKRLDAHPDYEKVADPTNKPKTTTRKKSAPTTKG